jgi:hypothetical protein
MACSTSPTLPDEPLQDRYWRVVEIDGKAVQAAANKSEPHVVLASDLRDRRSRARPGQTVPWFGVRNYQARNFMRDTMQIGDWPSSIIPVVPRRALREFARSVPSPTRTQLSLLHLNGIFRVLRSTRISTQNPARISRAGGCAMCVSSASRATCPLAELRAHPELANMRLLARGNRLSITPVSDAEWAFITQELMGQ